MPTNEEVDGDVTSYLPEKATLPMDYRYVSCNFALIISLFSFLFIYFILFHRPSVTLVAVLL